MIPGYVHVLAVTKNNWYKLEASADVSLWVHQTFKANHDFVGETPNSRRLAVLFVPEKIFVMIQLRWTS